VSLDLRERQRPLKEHYRQNPAGARLVHSVQSIPLLDDPLHARITAGGHSWEMVAHAMAGGPEGEACSGDVLLAALAGCQEITIKMVAAAMGRHLEITEALCKLSCALTRLGEPAVARAHLEEALSLARSAGERRHVAFALQASGEAAFTEGEYAEAGRLWQESLAHYRDADIGMGLATVENFLGQLAVRQGDLATARAHYEASLGHQQGWRALYWAPSSLAGLAAVAAAAGQAGRSLRLAGAATALGEAAALRLPGPEQEVLEGTIEAARAALDERAAPSAWAEGQAMTLEEAVALALEGDPAT